MTTRTEIVFEIDQAALGGYSDSWLAALWHVGQANPAPHGDRAAGELAEGIGREIIRRWLAAAPPELWRHQGRDYYWDRLRRLGHWDAAGEFVADDPGAQSATGTDVDVVGGHS